MLPKAHFTSYSRMSGSPCLSLLFFPQLFVKPSQKATLPSTFLFLWNVFGHCHLYNVFEPPSIVLQALCLPDLIPWIYSSSPLYNHKGFDLDHTWMAQWFPYFLQFNPEFCNKELMIWATVSSWSFCCCWLYTASPSSCPSQYRLASTRRQPASSLPRSGHWAPNLGPK